jgi:hypothetical protein
MIEKRVAVNKEQLVLTTEAALQSQIAGYSSTTNTHKTSTDGMGEEDK